MFKNIQKVKQQEGFFALYRGFSASLFGIIHPLLFFPMYEKMKIYFKRNWEAADAEHLSVKFILAASILSKIGASLLSYPHEVLRSRLMYQKAELE